MIMNYDSESSEQADENEKAMKRFRNLLFIYIH